MFKYTLSFKELPLKPESGNQRRVSLFGFIVRLYLLLIFMLAYPAYSQNEKGPILYDQFNRRIENSNQDRNPVRPRPRIESSNQNRTPERSSRRRPSRPEGLIINGRFIGPGDPEYERIQGIARQVEEQHLSSRDIPGYQYRGQIEGMDMWRDRKSGVTFVDNTRTQLIRDGKPSVSIFEDGRVKVIDSRNPRYTELITVREDLNQQKRIDRRSREQRSVQRDRNGQIRTSQQVSPQSPQRLSLLRRFVKSIKGIGMIIASLGIASEVVEGSTHWSDVPARLGEEAFSGDSEQIDGGTISFKIDNMLERLKADVQKLDPEKKFSQGRQRLNNALRTLYTDVQTDTGFSNEEKEHYLNKIAEIQDIAQPSLRSFPQRPPNRRSRGEGERLRSNVR